MAIPTRTHLAVAALIVLFGWLALQVHDSIAGLGEMARGIRDTGASIETSGRVTSNEIRRSVGSAADTLDRLPIVGGEASRSMRDTANSTAAAVERETRVAGRRLVVAGRQGERDARDTARLVGWLAFLIPTALLLVQVAGRLPAVPRRAAARPRAAPAPHRR